MTTTTTTTPDRTAFVLPPDRQVPVGCRTEVVEVRTTHDWAQYQLLLAAQRRWLEWETGVDVTRLQPSVEDEYADPEISYARSGTAGLLARLCGQPVGIAALRPLDPAWASEPVGPTVELKRVFVTAEARGRGAGRALVESALRLAYWWRAREVVLETHEGFMQDAVALYRQAGFVEAPALGLTELEGVLTLVRPLVRET